MPSVLCAFGLLQTLDLTLVLLPFGGVHLGQTSGPAECVTLLHPLKLIDLHKNPSFKLPSIISWGLWLHACSVSAPCFLMSPQRAIHVCLGLMTAGSASQVMPFLQ